MAARKALGLLLMGDKPKGGRDEDDDDLDDEAGDEGDDTPAMGEDLEEAYARFCDAKDDRDYAEMDRALDDILELKGVR